MKLSDIVKRVAYNVIKIGDLVETSRDDLCARYFKIIDKALTKPCGGEPSFKIAACRADGEVYGLPGWLRPECNGETVDRMRVTLRNGFRLRKLMVRA